jgi:hypothetical protein
VGRALIQVVLLRRGAVSEGVPPISLALATDAREYRACLYDLQHWTERDEGRKGHRQLGVALLGRRRIRLP